MWLYFFTSTTDFSMLAEQTTCVSTLTRGAWGISLNTTCVGLLSFLTKSEWLGLVVGISGIEPKSTDLKGRCIASYAIFPFCDRANRLSPHPGPSFQPASDLLHGQITVATFQALPFLAPSPDSNRHSFRQTALAIKLSGGIRETH